MILKKNTVEKYHVSLFEKNQNAVIKRKGGGTLIENAPVFSLDAKHLFLNCGWGIKVFNIKTGECVRILDNFSKQSKIVTVLVINSYVAAVTSCGKVLEWDSSGKLLSNKVVFTTEKEEILNAFLVPNFKERHKNDLCLLISTHEPQICKVLFYNIKKKKIIRQPLSDLRIKYENIKHNVSFGGAEVTLLMATVSLKKLFVYSLDGVHKLDKGYKPGKGREWSCVRCHPEESLVAGGDSTGRIVLYKEPFRKGGACAVYHWHTLPCRDISFTATGSSLYSGGGEHVLVKWDLENPHLKNFVPRLSAEIVHIAVSPDNQFVAVSTTDNSVQIVDSSNWLMTVLQQLAWGVVEGSPKSSLFPAGLQFDPRTRSLILNARPGHLQFFSPSTETLLFNLDVTMENYLSQEREKKIVNTEVTHTAMSSDGSWLGTIETRDDSGVCLELRLKLWQYLPSKKCFNLSTCAERPHNGPVHSLKFKPGLTAIPSSDAIDLDYIIVTTGDDQKFRLWAPSEIDSIYKRGVVWSCESVAGYRNKSCGPVSFSEDGSLLAVGFEQTLTIWDLDEVTLKSTLTRDHNILRFVEFGRKEGSHLVITGTESELTVWNLLTLSLMWRVQITPSLLVPDPASSHLAVFTEDNSLYIFTPTSMEPIYQCKEFCSRDAKLIDAIFLPRQQENFRVPHWLQNSQLYFIDSSQELKAFEGEDEGAEKGGDHFIKEDKESGTLFSILIKAQSAKTMGEVKPVDHLHFGVLGAKAVSEILKAPAHTMPPVSLMCSSLLRSFALSRRPHEISKMEISEDEEEEVMSLGSDLSSNYEEEELSQKKTKKSRKKKIEVSRNQVSFLTDFSNIRNAGGETKTSTCKGTAEVENIELREEDFLLDEDDEFIIE